MLPPVQKVLDGVVGLMKQDWPMFTEHLVYHVAQYHQGQKKLEEQNRQQKQELT